METKSSTTTMDNGATVETATVIVGGKEFSALGAVVDLERGVISGYPKGSGGQELPRTCPWNLTTWAGEVLGPITLVNTWEQRTRNGFKVRMFAWRFVARDGRRYIGRNSGEGMILHLRLRKDQES